MSNTYLTGHGPLTEATPQSLPIPGTAQVPNSANGYAWAIDDWTRLDRFLILGSEGGSYYANEQKLTRENIEACLRCIAADGERVVARIVEISESGRAPKNDPALFLLAACTGAESLDTRRAALSTIPRVARIGTHLFHFVQFVQEFRKWGRGLRSGIANWYLHMNPDHLALQAIKYQQRDGWSHRDVLRKAHPQTSEETRNAILHWMTHGWESVGDMPHPDPVLAHIWAFERAKNADVQETINLINDYHLPREAVPTPMLKEQAVWEALLERMPMEAMIRNLATMTRVGLLAPESEATRTVCERLGNQEILLRARLHPIKILAALLTYKAGHGTRGKHTWEPVAEIVDALDAAFYAAFGAVQPTAKRIVLALDVSASMTWGTIAGIPGLTPRVGSAAMALVTAATEQQVHIMAFCHKFVPLDISPQQRLDDALEVTDNLRFGGTDCALPMLWAMKHQVDADAFVIYTDSETWVGKTHPAQALRQYRKQTGIPAKLIVVGMVANNFTIADPDDAGMLDVVGFDMATPQLISDFIA